VVNSSAQKQQRKVAHHFFNRTSQGADVESAVAAVIAMQMPSETCFSFR
jgi:hypothetical protein